MKIVHPLLRKLALVTALLATTSALAATATAVAPPAAGEVLISGELLPGALLRGRVQPGSRVVLDDKPLSVDEEGFFIFGLGREASGVLTLQVSPATGTSGRRHSLAVKPRQYDVQRIDGLPQSKVTPDQKALARIAREQRDIDAARAQRNATQGYREAFQWPLKGRISGVFGSQRILNGVPRNPHSGLDIAAPTGTPVAAPAAGRVVLAAPDLYYSGNTVIIDHGLGLSSTLIHLSRMHVQAGDWIAAGDVIGEVGQTGRATGPHLHWGINWLDQRLDPQLLLD